MRSYRFPALIAALFLIPIVSFAADIRTGETLFIPSNEYSSDNLYLAGGEITVSGTVGRDLTAAGGKIIVNGPTTGDILIAAGTADLLERVSGDVRIVGGQVSIGGAVGGDVIAIGGKVHLVKGSSVSRDIIVIGGEIVIDAAVNGNVEVYGGTVTLNGLVGGDVMIHAGDSVTFGENAIIGNTVTYVAPQEAVVSEGARLGEVVYKKSAVPREVIDGAGIAAIFATVAGVMLIVKFFAFLTAAIVVALVLKRFSENIVTRTISSFWSSVGIGLVAFLVSPVVLLILAFTVVGLVIAAILWFFYLLVVIVAAVYSGIILGGYLSKLIKKDVRASWQWAALGTFTLSLISLVPIIGWVVTAIFFLAAFGTLAQNAFREIQSKM